MKQVNRPILSHVLSWYSAQLHYHGAQIALLICRSAGFRAALAGLAAGPTILLTGYNVRHDDLALYIFLRGLTLLVRCGNRPAPAGCGVTPRWEHGDVALMCAASWQILYAYVMVPRTLPPGYIHFLDRMSGVPRWTIPALKV
jgi:hypothetical protein